MFCVVQGCDEIVTKGSLICLNKWAERNTELHYAKSNPVLHSK
jgi:hypothetical protein